MKYLLLLVFLIGCKNEIDTIAARPKVDRGAEISSSSTGDSTLIQPQGQTIATRIAVPTGFVRATTAEASFAGYLANFPVKEDGLRVKLFDGRDKPKQDIHAAILDIDVGQRDLQQCADAVIRLRAEYLWSQKRYADIQFNFTNGFAATYSKWRDNYRIRVEGNNVHWVKTTRESVSYSSFRQYLHMVFAYSGTQSLFEELKPQPLEQIQIGDVLIRGGFPGHAVLVVDQAVNPGTGEKLVLLAQSYMPAQDIHLLKNLQRSDISPWYSTNAFTAEINTPEWTFKQAEIMAFR